jgi:hypothetical protein
MNRFVWRKIKDSPVPSVRRQGVYFRSRTLNPLINIEHRTFLSAWLPCLHGMRQWLIACGIIIFRKSEISSYIYATLRRAFQTANPYKWLT